MYLHLSLRGETLLYMKGNMKEGSYRTTDWLKHSKEGGCIENILGEILLSIMAIFD